MTDHVPPREAPDRNHLAEELSPYLQQHAGNPVHWYPWGEAAFTRAAELDRPIFLSIGYATCHWCHVMEHESFEDPEVARLMNEAFVNIKVDREERPDVDQVYMEVCQLLTGSGGWPLTILMTPDKRPFFAATYLPRESRHGRMGMLDLVPKIQQVWTEQRAQVEQSSAGIVEHLQRQAPASGHTESAPEEVAAAAYRQLASRFDHRHGGFGGAPKFPSPHNLLFLLRLSRHGGDPNARQMALRTLDAMRCGGLYDHLGFGFHRYSTDPHWLLPHFEKMLYDQAMLCLAYTEAFATTGAGRYRTTACEILHYVWRDLSSPDGGFYSAEDADSEGEEGKFYLWTEDELEQLLDADAAAAAKALWRVRGAGNFADEASGRVSGANILHLDPAVSARADDEFPDALGGPHDGLRETLLEHRAQRPRPLLDDKILSDWNGLMTAATARAGRVFRQAETTARAAAAAEFLWTTMRDETGRLLHRHRHGRAGVHGFLDDYAFFIWGLLELYGATLDPLHLERADELTELCRRHFEDVDGGGFFFTADDAEELPVRSKEVYDGAIPSGNSVMLANLIRLYRLSGRPELMDSARRLQRAFAADLRHAPSAHCHLVDAMALAEGGRELVVAGGPEAADTQALLDAARQHMDPDDMLLLLPTGPEREKVVAVAPFTADYGLSDGRAAAYVCRDFSCELPVTTPVELEALLKA